MSSVVARTPTSCKPMRQHIAPPRTGPYFSMEPFGAISAPPVAPAKVRHERAKAVGTMIGSIEEYTRIAGASVMPVIPANAPMSAVRLVGFVLLSVYHIR